MAVFQYRGHVPFSSDQAVIALMAEDILDHHKHPVFCYGSEYGGTLEAHLIAAAFAVFGRTATVYRLATCLLVLGIVIAVWFLTSLAYDRRAAFIAGLYLAVGPAFFLYKTMTSDGSYVSLVLCSACALASLLLLDRQVESGGSALPATAGLGFFAGLAWWQHSPSVFLVAPIAAWLLTAPGRRWFGAKNIGVLMSSLLLGSFPWWWHNARHGWLSVHAPELRVVSADGGDGLLVRLVELVTVGFPILLGSASIRFAREWLVGGRWFVWCLLGFVAFAALRDVLDAESERTRRMSLVLGAGLVAVAALTLPIQRTEYGEPRYLVTIFVVLAPLLGRGLSRWKSSWAATACLGAILAFNLGSQLAAPVVSGLAAGCKAPTAQDLVAWVEGQGVQFAYSSYWTAYRLSFLSGGHIASAPLGSGSNSFQRSDALLTAVGRSENPALLLEGEDWARFRLYMKRRGVPIRAARYSRFWLVRDIPPGLLVELRRCLCIPAGAKPGDVEWQGLDLPKSIQAGSQVNAAVHFRLNTEFPPASNVRLGYRWTLSGEPASEKGPDRAGLVAFGRDVRQNIALLGPHSPGRYRLAVGLVDENISWFSDAGNSVAEAEVAVQ